MLSGILNGSHDDIGFRACALSAILGFVQSRIGRCDDARDEQIGSYYLEVITSGVRKLLPQVITYCFLYPRGEIDNTGLWRVATTHTHTYHDSVIDSV